MKPTNPSHALVGGILIAALLFALALTFVGVARAAPPPGWVPVELVEGANTWIGRATGPTATFCVPGTAYFAGAVKCSEGTYLNTGYKISDGGTHALADGGEPLAASSTDDLFLPVVAGAPTPKLDLSPQEHCVAIKVVSGDAGTCDFYKRNVP